MAMYRIKWDGGDTTIYAESHQEALCAAEEIVEEIGGVALQAEVYCVHPYLHGDLEYVGSRP